MSPVMFLRAGAIYAIANALAAGVPFLMLPVLTRVLSPQEFGVVIAFFLLVTLSNSVAGLSVHTPVAVRWFDRSASEFARFVASALWVALASTAVCCAILAVAGTLWHDRLGLPTWMWPLAAIVAGASVLAGMRTGLWQSQQRPLSAATLQVSGAALNLGLSLVAVLVFALGAAGRVGGAAAAAVASALAAIVLLRRTGEMQWAGSAADTRRLLRFGAPLVPHVLAAAVMATADRYAVSAQLGTGALGIYGTAAQLGMIVGVLGDAFSKAFSPWLYGQLARGSSAGRLRIVAATYLLVPVWLLSAMVVWGLLRWAGPWLLGEQFLAAVDLSLWFLLGGALASIYLNIAGLFFFNSRNEWLALATAGSAAVALALAPVMTARFGLTGAAVAYCGAQLAQLLLSFAASSRVRPMPWARPALALRVLARRARTRR